MAEFTPIETQEQLDAVLKDRLERAHKKYEGFISPSDFETKTKAYEEQIKTLQTAVEQANSKYAEFEKDLADRDAKIKGFETSALRLRIANELGLSYDATSYLRGESEEEIRSSAEGLKKLMTPKIPEFNSDNSGASDAKDAIKKLAHNLSV